MTIIRQKNITEQVYNRIKEMIISEEFKPGDKLPSQKELETMLGISRPTLREAISRLISQDIIEAHQGKGYFVKDPSTRTVLTIPAIESDKLTARNIFESRMFLEARLAQLACLYADDNELKELVELSRLEDRGELPDDIPYGNNAFHAKIAEISHNDIMAQFEYTLLNRTNNYTDLFSYPLKGPFYSKDEKCPHPVILKAIVDRDHIKAFNCALMHVMEYAVTIGVNKLEEYDYFKY